MQAAHATKFHLPIRGVSDAARCVGATAAARTFQQSRGEIHTAISRSPCQKGRRRTQAVRWYIWFLNFILWKDVVGIRRLDDLAYYAHAYANVHARAHTNVCMNA